MRRQLSHVEPLDRLGWIVPKPHPQIAHAHDAIEFAGNHAHTDWKRQCLSAGFDLFSHERQIEIGSRKKPVQATLLSTSACLAATFRATTCDGRSFFAHRLVFHSDTEVFGAQE
jgi:hypothetical protein